MNIKIIAAVAACAILSVVPARADSDKALVECRAEQDSLRRLTCYDAIAVDDENRSSRWSASPVAFLSAKLGHRPQDLRNHVFNPRIEMVPSFKNTSAKAVVGVVHKFTVLDAFGDVVVEQEDKLDVSIPAGKVAESTLYYFWEDNQFIHDEPYDRMWAQLGTEQLKSDLASARSYMGMGR